MSVPHLNLDPEAQRAIRSAQDYLLSIQKEDGHWCGELEGDTILESEYILAMHFMGKTEDPRVRKAANNLRQQQSDHGGWSIYPGGPAEVSASAKAYFVLKLVGDDPEAPHMQRARKKILDLGGLDACNSFTKLYLSIFGQYEWKNAPAVPPEIILLPRWFYFNIYEMSSWSRAIVVPLSMIWALKPHCPVPAHAQIPELRGGRAVPAKTGLWGAFFQAVDRGLKILEKLPVKPTRQFALKAAERWVLERLDGSHGLGAIFPPIVNTIIGLRAMGYPLDHPVIQDQYKELQRLTIEEGDTLRVQPCFSPVWDTAISVNALAESGLPEDHPRLQKAARWMMSRRGHDAGDWKIKLKDGQNQAPGWFFEYANPYYPDCDTTSQVLTALSKVRLGEGAEDAERIQAIYEGHVWHVSMQNKDGGWGAFDKDCDKEILCHVPFADHNAMIDPSTSDLTARGLETLAHMGHGPDYPPARMAIEFLRREQEADGSWYGRWGCNYLYGTWLSLWGLRYIGVEMAGEWRDRAVTWLRDCQNDDGGFGELPLSYDDPMLKGRGPSSPSQTAWALMGLCAAGDERSEAAQRAVDYLVRNQHEDGSWAEESWTGTGFPSVFYLRYHLYSNYFPLLALATWSKARRGEAATPLVAETA